MIFSYAVRATFSSFLLLLLLGSPIRAADDAPIILAVDATEAPRKLFKAKLTIPTKPGLLTLHYPKWIQGEHQPSGPILDLSGLQITAAGKTIPWKRDDVDLYAFHCTVPDGVSSIDVALEYLIPGDKGGYGAGPASTAKLAILNWYLVTLYPVQGRHVRDIPIKASLTLPKGWDAGSALPVESKKDSTIQFKTVPLEMLADSPVLCGKYFREIPIGPKEGPQHFMDLACDSAAGLEMDAEWIDAHSKLVEEAGALFGARHYRSYHFLVSLTEQFGHNAIEHHECSDNRLPERMYTDESNKKLTLATVLSHEYFHSWNGKYRRPAGLATPNFQEPMKTKLLWVYEGLTEYYGLVLAARSGMFPVESAQMNLAEIADWAKNQKGRTWRPLEDTATAAPFLYSSRSEWSQRRRGVDFYDEGTLIWLDADTLIREKTDGKKSLDDFCKAFHGGENSAPAVKPYEFEDVVKALNSVVKHDWKTFLEKRVTGTDAEPPLDGIIRGGWKLEYEAEPSELRRAEDDQHHTITLTSSIGLSVSDEGKITDVVPGKAADKAGLGPHMKVLAVNGRRFDGGRLREAIADTAEGKVKLELLVENGDYIKSHALDYKEGDRHPHLKRDESKVDRISDIFEAKTNK